MIYKPGHVSDLKSGAIIDVSVRPGDAADNDASMAQRMLAVGTLIEVVTEAREREKLGVAVEQIGELQRCGVRTLIADPHEGRRRADAPVEHRQTLRRAARATRSASGKALLRKRGEHLERGFAHVLDQGGFLRATLRGCENLTKRHLIAALSFNLSLLRTLFGTGTAKQWLAGHLEFVLRRIGAFNRVLETLSAGRGRVCQSFAFLTSLHAEHPSWQLGLAT